MSKCKGKVRDLILPESLIYCGCFELQMAAVQSGYADKEPALSRRDSGWQGLPRLKYRCYLYRRTHPPGASSMPESHPLPPGLNDEILKLGRRIFSRMGEDKPGAFSKNFWAHHLTEWAMRRPEFKVNMFRLVDVLPALRSSRAIASHVREYLEKPAAEINPLLFPLVRAGTLWPFYYLLSFAIRNGARQMASQMIAGRDPHAAIAQLKRIRMAGLAYTIDLLGEYCLGESDARAYFDRYIDALEVLGKETPGWPESRELISGHTGEREKFEISVKLSALYSQISPLNFDRSVGILAERLSRIALKASEHKASLCVDAEDMGSNPVIYAAFKRAFGSAELVDFPRPGIVLQCYAPRSESLLDDLVKFSAARAAPISIRLVKGAYWDYETVRSLQNSSPSPLFAEKRQTDRFYEHMSRRLLDRNQDCYAAFGSHNVRSLSHACAYAWHIGLSPLNFELQALYGMAEPIARAFAAEGYLTRLYVPLGRMLAGMGYLVRRLLENTSNESFLRHTFFEKAAVDRLLLEP